jgi:phosphate uptake regulator
MEDFYVRIEKMVGNTVGEIVGDALQIISERFDEVDKRFKQMDERFDRLEDKTDTIAASVDHHTIDIRELQRKTA